jgi:hypothetical protein
MDQQEPRSIASALVTVGALAIVLALLGYFATRMLDADVSGSANARTGLSAALLAAIACVSAAAGAAILWAGRSKPRGNTRIALVATVVIGVFLLFVAFAAGTSSTEPASIPGPLNTSV